MLNAVKHLYRNGTLIIFVVKMLHGVQHDALLVDYPPVARRT